MFGAFYPNYFKRGHNSEMEKMANRKLNRRDPKTCVYLTGFPVDQAPYGILYENQFKQMFVDAMWQDDADNINVAVEGQNVIVEFARPMQVSRH